MDYKTIARRIPNNVRRQRLLVESDPISNAIPTSVNPAMQLLYAVYTTFIDKSGNVCSTCPIVLQNIIDNFRQIKGALMELEREQNLLDSV